MATETERKFLLQNTSWKDAVEETHSFRQGYLASSAGITTRVRIADNQAFLTIKGRTIAAISRPEFEYEIPRADAELMLMLFCGAQVIVKHRSILHFGEHRWEIDEFHGENEGLVVAEIELKTEDEKFEIPPWLGREVSFEPRFRNSHMLRYPYSRWTDEERK